MMKIVLLLWVMSPTGEIAGPTEFPGWRSIAECEAAAEAFTAGNPADNNKILVPVARCIEVPK